MPLKGSPPRCMLAQTAYTGSRQQWRTGLWHCCCLIPLISRAEVGSRPALLHVTLCALCHPVRAGLQQTWCCTWDTDDCPALPASAGECGQGCCSQDAHLQLANGLAPAGAVQLLRIRASIRFLAVLHCWSVPPSSTSRAPFSSTLSDSVMLAPDNCSNGGGSNTQDDTRQPENNTHKAAAPQVKGSIWSGTAASSCTVHSTWQYLKTSFLAK